MRTASALATLMTLPALAADPAAAANPFFTEWKTPFGVPSGLSLSVLVSV